LEEEAERKIGWCLKIFFAGTATYIGYQFFPYLGDNLIHQSISLLHVKDPLFKRMGASRLSRFAIDGKTQSYSLMDCLRYLFSLTSDELVFWLMYCTLLVWSV
jgi:hypothetical protein